MKNTKTYWKPKPERFRRDEKERSAKKQLREK
jgi:hypothetical protein